MLKRTLVRFRELLERVALVAFGFLLALALLEGGLRLAAAFVGPRPASEIARTDRRTVLCLGDSNTYGIAYGPEQAYPGQLQTILERRDPGRFRVLNLALPGTNSSEIVGQLPAWIDRYQPSAVVLLVGINNLWNRTGAEKHWWSRTRSYRLYELLRARLEQELPGPNPTGRVEWARELRDEGRKGEEYRDAHTGRVLARHDGNVWGEYRDPASAWAILDRDLDAILAELRRRDVDLFLLTYASFPLPGRGPLHQEAADASDVLRRFGSANGVPVIDVHDRFLALLPPGTPRAKYFWKEKDGHPNPAGYAEVARMVADRLLPVLDPASSAVPEPAADLLDLAAAVAVTSLARKRLPTRRPTPI